MATKKKLLEAAAGALDTPDTGDPEFANVALLLDGDGPSDDNNNTFTDSSTNGFTVTESGSVVQGSFSPYGDNWSNYFGGDSGLNFGDVTAVDFDANDWTMELWWNPQDLSSGDPFVFKDNVATRSFQFRHSNSSTNEIVFLFWSSNTLYNSETSNEFVYSSGFDVGEWYHIALVHDSGTFECFVNGTSIGTWTPAASNIDSGTDTLNVGYYSGGTPDYASGYLSNVRVVNGTALYTSSFTPSTTPLTAVTNTTLLTCQSNRFKDNSSNDYSVTVAGTPKVTPFSPFKDDDARDITTDGGSGFFNGSGNYLSLSNSIDLKPGASGAFSAEFWYYPTGTGTGTARQIMGTMTVNSYPSNVVGWDFVESGSTSNIAFRWGSPSYQDTGGSSAIMKVNQWNHVAVCRDAEATPTLSFFLNGTRTFSTTSNTSISDASSGTFYVGYGTYTGTPIDPALGNISDARVMKGSTAYDPTQTTLTVPTSPLTAITNTKLLTNFQDAGIYDRSGINNLDTVGNARLGFAPIYGTGSLAFDGTGDYLSVQNENDLFTVGSGDYTVECWINTSDTVGEIVSAFSQSLPHPGWLFGIGFPEGDGSKNGLLSFYQANSSNSETKHSTARVDDGSWRHVAVSKSGTTLRFFIDGALDSTHTLSYVSTGSGEPIRIGADNNTSPVRYLDGYIDDLRITKGIARYTSAFTPPTEIDISLDTHAEYVTLFLDGDGTVNGQNNTFTDSSTSSATITETGSVVQGVFSPYGDNWSVFFDGSNDYIELPANSNYVFGTGDFTIEAWINTDGSDFFSIFQNCPFNSSAATDDYFFGVNSAGKLEFSRHGGFATCASANGAVSFNEWHHIAVTRTSSVMTVWLDGASAGTSTDSNLISYNINQNVAHTIGWRVTPNYGGGYLSNLRVLNGTALYTTGFTVPTSPLTAITNTVFLGLQSNRFIDNSTVDNSITAANSIAISRFSPFESNKPYDITTDGGSAYFNGSSDLASSRSVNWSTYTDITLEAWVYPTSLSSNTAHVLMGTASGAFGYTAFYLYSDGRIGIGITGVNEIASSSGAVIDNEWQHVAAVKSGSTTTLYVNGTSVASNTTAVWSNNSAVVRVARANTTERLYGYMSDARILLGTALAPSTLPTSPLTAITNTELLLNFQDSAIPDLSGINNIDTVGNAKVAGSDPTKYGSNAMQFDGSGDDLRIDVTDPISFSGYSGDFTTEMWVYPTAVGQSSNSYVWQHASSSTAYSPFIIVQRPSTYEFAIYASSNGSSWNLISNATIGTATANAWHHIAVVRDGTNIKAYMNGTVGSTSAVSTTALMTTSGQICIGSALGSSNSYFTGFIDDFRITKGIARYTANFTPPSEALPKF